MLIKILLQWKQVKQLMCQKSMEKVLNKTSMLAIYVNTDNLLDAVYLSMFFWLYIFKR